jgi:hypothetical protein
MHYRTAGYLSYTACRSPRSCSVSHYAKTWILDGDLDSILAYPCACADISTVQYSAHVDHVTRVCCAHLGPNAYAAVLATKEGPLCHQSWSNEAKSRPIGRPWLAVSSPSAKGRTTLGQDGAIIFGRANIDLPGEQSPAEP